MDEVKDGGNVIADAGIMLANAGGHVIIPVDEILPAVDKMVGMLRVLNPDMERTWDCYTLSEGDIKNVAELKGISLEGIDLDGVIHYIKKGIEWALTNRDEIIEDAIKQASRAM